MANTKLKLEHITPYLPYGLKLFYDDIPKKQVIELVPNHFDIDWRVCFYSKPILRPLSDLPKQKDCENELWEQCNDIDENLDYICEFDDDLFKTSLSYKAVSILIMWKFDVFGLIKKGLAKNILELEGELLNEAQK